MDIISHGGTIIVSADTEAEADRATQIQRGVLMTQQLSKTAKGGRFYGN